MKSFLLLSIVVALVSLSACGGGTAAVVTPQSFTISVAVTGLSGGGTLVLQDNASQQLSFTADGTKAFSNTYSSGAQYSVSMVSQPTGETCTPGGNTSGTMTANVTVTVSCSVSGSGFTISGTVSGLPSGASVTLADNTTDTLPLTSNGPFTFNNQIASGSTYNVTVATQPTGGTCTVTNGSGTATANVTNVTVVCSAVVVTYSIGGTLSGLASGASIVLADNGGDPLSLSANGAFAFATKIASGGAYAVTVQTQPIGQTCTVTNGTGTALAAVTNVQVTCTTNASYTIGGTVTGLPSGVSFVLANGTDTLNITTNGAFTFAKSVASGSAYNVIVQTQPSGGTCTVSNGSGTATANVTNVQVTCSATTFSIGGTLSGLPSGATVVLANNTTDTLSLTANGTFTFATKVASGSGYSVVVQTQPSTATCTVANGSGTATADVTNVQVTCTPQYSIGGTLSGLASGTTVVLADNTTDTLSLTANGSFTFAKKIASGGAYSVTVATQPAGQSCTVSNGSGTATANVTNVSVTCTTIQYSIGGSLSGLASGAGVTLVDNSTDTLNLTANGTFTFGTKVSSGGAYNVQVQTQPSGQTCTVANGVGTATANVTNVLVTCTATQAFTIGGTVSGLASGASVVLSDNGTFDTLTVTQNGLFTFAKTLQPNSAYAVTVKTQPSGQTCTVTNGSGTATANVTNIQVTCANNATLSLSVSVTGLNGGTLVVQDDQSKQLSFTSNKTQTFSNTYTSGASYSVSVVTQPTGQTCTLSSNSSGTITANTTVTATCTTNSGGVTISVAVSGLSGTAEFTDDQGDTLTFNSNTTLTFPKTYASGASYAVNASLQPASQACTPTYSSGTISSNITIAVACATGSTRKLGTVSGVSTISCSGAIKNGVCQQMTVSCPGVPDVFAYVKTNTPSGTSKGTVTYATGTGGNGLYESIYTFGSTAVQNVIDGGFTTVQISWGTPFNNNQPNGWVQGTGGVLAAACRYATVTNWIYTNIQNNSKLPMCATANSGGAGALAYALTQYPSYNVLSMAEVTSGPPTGRLDWGCGCTHGKVAVSCGSVTTMGTCFGASDSPVWDPAYLPSLQAKPYCSNAAVNGVLPPGGLDYFLGDSSEAPGATYNLPHTFVNLVFGGQDNSSAIPSGQDWFNQLTNSSLKGQECIADAPHSIPNVLDGAQQIATDLINNCKLH